MPKGLAGSLTISASLLVFFLPQATRRFEYPFPPLAASMSTSVTSLQDFIGIAMGLRRLTADLAWIQTLTYYGTHEHSHGHEEFEDAEGSYPLFLSNCQRVTRIDPYFKYVYYYGVGVLGWNLNRLAEAEELLKQGIQANPKEWRFQQYLGAMAFQKNHDVQKLAQFLESFVTEPDCPNLLRSILANIYKKQKRYQDAIRVWTIVYETGDRNYVGRAESQIRQMLPLSGEMGLKFH